MTAPRLFVSAAEVAHLLGISSATAFLARRSDLEGRLGFPSPVPWQRRPLLWRRESVERWVDGLGEVPSAALQLVPDQADAARRVVMLHMARTA